ncbi:protein ENHANCED DOWNY MILDEW 2-like [Rhodamnia argentea]|uniref:Protein ENHANCED DOWNY MILDEW 2-like n=1 Tax=Rhodamnia argentea TaxID=178133 RepID=A0ABM3HGC8_9MYRT|nr:protein ENHANCED DOWNY MILDEW 2-like [Rhodamnia argentea]
MASSDDKAENLPERVSTYYFKNHDDEPVSFSVLPVRWSDREGGDEATSETIFLHGTADNGLRKIYREVKSWRFDLGSSRPQVSVLSKDNICFKLEDPRRSFQDTTRTVLITLHCLHYARNHPDASGQALWKHLARTLGFYEVRPSAKDLQDHVELIKEAIGRDDALAKSKVLNKLMEEKPWERSKSGKNVAKPSFIMHDTEDVGMEDVEDGTAKEDDCFYSVCAQCDNSGDRLCSYERSTLSPYECVAYSGNGNWESAMSVVHFYIPLALTTVRQLDLARFDENSLLYLWSTLGERLYSSMTKPSEQMQPGKKVIPDSEEKKAMQPASEKSDDSSPALDADTERRLLNLMKEAESSVTMEDVMRRQNVPSTYAQYQKSTVDKAITIGKVERSVQAARAALQRLEEGGSNEDAKAICDPDVLAEIFKWKDKLGVYLAPFTYGMRYTSFGRHFTKVDKLQEIVNELHWYARDGDMIVDFCCGANDFSCLMAKKLEETGKKCSYKNYDIFPPKNNFEFELRDWMTVQQRELPSGSKLIMGLNPPFGVRAALANKFIDKALEFKPKLLILIVPSETERLAEKKFQYDLVWKDDRFLSGKSFYLPGSVDVKDKQIEQWNNKPPLLYLWSRRDWTTKHRTIAQKQGHLQSNDDCNGSLDLHYLKDDRSLCIGTPSLTSDTSMPMGRTEETKERVNIAGDQKECFSRSDSGRQSRESQSTGPSVGKANVPRQPSPNLKIGKSWSNDRSSKEKAGSREIDEELPAKVTSRRPSPKWSVNDRSSRSHEVPFEKEVSGMNYQHADPGMSMSLVENFYGGRGSTLSADASRMYGLNYNRYYPTQNSVGPAHMRFNANYGPHVSEPEERYWRDLDMRSQVRLYGQQYPNVSTRNYGVGYDPSNGFARMGSMAVLAQRGDMTAVQRYAPRLDEMNPTSTNNERPEATVIRGNEHLDPNRGQGPQFGHQGYAFGFAAGPRWPYYR